MRKTGLLLLGGGGYGAALKEFLVAAGCYAPITVLDDRLPGARPLADYTAPELRAAHPLALAAFGDNALRLQWLQRLAGVGYELPVYRHPTAVVSPSAALGPGTVVLPFAYIGAGAVLGAGCIVNAGAILDHNVTLGRGCHAAPGSILKAGAAAADFAKIESGTVLPSPWDTAKGGQLDSCNAEPAAPRLY